MGENNNNADDDAKLVELIELMFFAYRDFVSDPDEILANYGFGRAHHRVIHFVGRHPGIRVSQLLEILQITKQSLGRVLKDLIDGGFVCQREGPTDRRRRLLTLTDKGCQLHRELMDPQLTRFRRALSEIAASSDGAHRDLLFNLIDEEERPHIQKLFKTAATRCVEPAPTGD